MSATTTTTIFLPVREVDLAAGEEHDPLVGGSDPIHGAALLDMKNPVLIAKPGENKHPYELFDVLRILEANVPSKRRGPLTRAPFTLDDVHPIRIQDSRLAEDDPQRAFYQRLFHHTASSMLAVFVQRDDVARVEALVQHFGVNVQCQLVDERSGKRMTPLHIALATNRLRMAHWLIAYELHRHPSPQGKGRHGRPNLDVANSDGLTPFLMAVSLNLQTTIAFLFHEADAMPLERQHAVFRGRTAREVLLTQVDPSGAGAVAMAARDNLPCMVSLLASPTHGICAPVLPFPLPSNRHLLSRSPVISAIEYDVSPSMLRVLTQLGAGTVTATRGKMSALAVAAQHGRHGLLYMLLRLRVEPTEEAFVEAAAANQVHALRAFAYPEWITAQGSAIADVADDDLEHIGVAPILSTSIAQERQLVRHLTKVIWHFWFCCFGLC